MTKILPAVLDEPARRVLEPAIARSNVDWAQVEHWLAEGSACLWSIDDGKAFVLTVATESEIEGLLCGGRDVRRWAADFEAAMRALPVHAGRALVINGRKGWRRILPHWQASDSELRLQ